MSSIRSIGIAALVMATLVAPVEARSKKASEPWRAVHVLGYDSDADLETLAGTLDSLAGQGMNVLILEVDYSFDFRSHPELRSSDTPITRAGARTFAAECRKRGIRLIPQFQCLGHQSWAAHTGPLLSVYPMLDVTPFAFPGNKGIYCREWDPTSPDVYRIVLPLLDEIIDAFQADAIHVGMDEVFLLGSEKSPSTKGKDPAELFAKAVNDLHRHLVGKRHVEMLMWADRLIDGKAMDFGEWEASENGTAAAIDMIPKDIIMCPWHYEKRDAYPSIPMFLEKGFRVVPAMWKNVDSNEALIAYCREHATPKLLGFMFTTWDTNKGEVAEYEPVVKGLAEVRGAKAPEAR